MPLVRTSLCTDKQNCHQHDYENNKRYDITYIASHTFAILIRSKFPDCQRHDNVSGFVEAIVIIVCPELWQYLIIDYFAADNIRDHPFKAVSRCYKDLPNRRHSGFWLHKDQNAVIETLLAYSPLFSQPVGIIRHVVSPEI